MNHYIAVYDNTKNKIVASYTKPLTKSLFGSENDNTLIDYMADVSYYFINQYSTRSLTNVTFVVTDEKGVDVLYKFKLKSEVNIKSDDLSIIKEQLMILAYGALKANILQDEPVTQEPPVQAPDVQEPVTPEQDLDEVATEDTVYELNKNKVMGIVLGLITILIIGVIMYGLTMN